MHFTVTRWTQKSLPVSRFLGVSTCFLKAVYLKVLFILYLIMDQIQELIYAFQLKYFNFSSPRH